jgi:hypothetical protein
MNVIKRSDVFNKFHNGMERIDSYAIDKIIIHGTGGGASAYALLDGWILTPGFERARAYRNGEGFPYLVDRNGDIIELCDTDKYWQYHSGTWVPGKSYQHDMSTIGIELVNPHPTNQVEYKPDQYASLIEFIIGTLLIKFDIKEIWGHGAFQFSKTGKGKVCPGPRFDWNILINEMISSGWQFEAAAESITNITKEF